MGLKLKQILLFGHVLSSLSVTTFKDEKLHATHFHRSDSLKNATEFTLLFLPELMVEVTEAQGMSEGRA